MNPTDSIAIREANSSAEIGMVRELLLEYQQALGIDLCFQGFAAELENLPGEYAPPRGRLLLARVADDVAGCVALRPLSGDAGEMKRLYVRPAYRALSVGRQLAKRLIVEARAIGYRQILLDTLPEMDKARRLYESLGFIEVAPYRHNPIAGTRFLGLAL
jgi:ribosomal protein S18 acetylase RimI-like enzyme